MNLPIEICAIVNSYAPYFRIDTPRVWYYFCIHCKRESCRVLLGKDGVDDFIMSIVNRQLRDHDCNTSSAFEFDRMAPYICRKST